MSNLAIDVSNLGKSYRVAQTFSNSKYRTLRDDLILWLKQLSPHCHNKSKAEYETHWALKDISIQINQGEILGIIGANGAGKSTFLKILSRITTPTEGKIKLYGRVASLLEVGTGFHSELTGRENVYLSGCILGMRKKEIDAKFNDIISFAGIAKFIDTPVKRYSSGMSVRLAFSVAAHLEPEILLVDEVLAVGDIAFQKKCIGKMKQVGKEHNRTIIFVSHQLGSIRVLCPNTLWIDKGEIKMYGPSDEIIKAYQNYQLDPQKINAVVHRNIKNPSHIYVASICMLDQHGEKNTVFAYNSFITFIVDIGNSHNCTKYSLELRVFRITGEFVTLGASGAFLGLFFDNNENKIKIKLGPLALTNGYYNISFSIVADSDRQDTWENACSFQIIDCHSNITGMEIDNRSICVLDTSFLAI